MNNRGARPPSTDQPSLFEVPPATLKPILTVLFDAKTAFVTPP